ncbi:hypothetical protein [Kitasatospora sp. NPDC088548]|uniref:hypothetical protein n=1 Tax=Kitasatospora sp. NPDC088548 TaxID=3364075 RepID=UPI00380F4B9C
MRISPLDRHDRRFLWALLIVVVAALLAVATAASILAIAPANPATTTAPDEDEPGFDCRIHGNRICGPTPAP